MPLFGVHESISNGFDGAVFAASANGFETVQIFSKNSNRWTAKPIEPKTAADFQTAMVEKGFRKPVIHTSYLINPASPEQEKREKSVAALAEELVRADALGIDGVVLHPGAYTTGTEESGLRLVSQSLDEAFRQAGGTAKVYLETTAGQGTNLGCKFEHLAEIISRSGCQDRLAVCLDTCHIFAAGYSFATRSEYDAMMEEFDRVVGIGRLKAFHLNDSVKGLGSRVDRHAHIGRGMIGREPFGFFVRDPRFADHPMYLETPKGIADGADEGRSWDVVNLATLRRLAGENP